MLLLSEGSCGEEKLSKVSRAEELVPSQLLRVNNPAGRQLSAPDSSMRDSWAPASWFLLPIFPSFPQLSDFPTSSSSGAFGEYQLHFSSPTPASAHLHDFCDQKKLQACRLQFLFGAVFLSLGTGVFF